jgi:hypothetical protein
MIEREAQIKVYNESLGAKGARRAWCGRAEGFYEVTLEPQGKCYTTLLPISSTVILAADPEEEGRDHRRGALGRLHLRIVADGPVLHVGLGPIGQGIARLVVETDGPAGRSAPPTSRPTRPARTWARCWASPQAQGEGRRQSRTFIRKTRADVPSSARPPRSRWSSRRWPR